MNPVRLNIQSLKYQTFTLSGCKDIGIQQLMFVAKACNSFIKLMNQLVILPVYFESSRFPSFKNIYQVFKSNKKNKTINKQSQLSTPNIRNITKKCYHCKK